MKKAITLFFLAIGSLFVNLSYGQITVDDNDFGDVGDSIEIWTDLSMLGSSNIGSKGPNQTWYFSIDSQSAFLDTLIFEQPSNTPGGSTFPSSNLALWDGESYQYFNKSTSALDLNGFFLDLDTFLPSVGLNIAPPIRIIDFPSTYGDASTSQGTSVVTLPFQDTIDLGQGDVYVDSIRVTVTINSIDSVVGWGTLYIDSGNTEVLRLDSRINLSFTLEAKVQIFGNIFIWFAIPPSLFPVPDLNIGSVRYIGKGYDYPVLTFDVDSAGRITNNQIIRLPVDSLGTGLQSNFAQTTPLEFYPNPVENELNIDCYCQLSEIQIMDIRGKFILNSSPNEAVVNVQKLEPGTYIIRTIDSQGIERVNRFIKK